MIAYRHVDSPPQDVTYEFAKLSKALLIIVFCVAMLSIFALVFDTLLVSKLRLHPFSLVYTAALFSVLCLGVNSGIFDLNVHSLSTFPRPISIPSGERHGAGLAGGLSFG